MMTSVTYTFDEIYQKEGLYKQCTFTEDLFNIYVDSNDHMPLSLLKFMYQPSSCVRLKGCRYTPVSFIS